MPMALIMILNGVIRMNKEDKAYFNALFEIGCCVCRIHYNVYSPPHMHHATGLKYRCSGKKASNDNVIPLCSRHHQYGSVEHPAIHSHPKLFEEKYGSQEELLKKTEILLDRGEQ